MKKNRILIFDTTLRDGEQCPGASMTLREKLEVARQLARLKVDVIEGGFPVISDGDFTAVSTIAREIKGPIIAGLARCVPRDIEASASTRAACAHAARNLVSWAPKRAAVLPGKSFRGGVSRNGKFRCV